MDKIAGLSEAKGEVTTFENVVLPKILTIAGSDSGAFIVYDVIDIHTDIIRRWCGYTSR